jgi:hypothetical protein
MDASVPDRARERLQLDIRREVHKMFAVIDRNDEKPGESFGCRLGSVLSRY